jgi:hypothetical protein
LRTDILAALDWQILHDAMTDHARRHPLAPKLRASMRVPKEIGQLSVLPAFARSSVAILDKINYCYIGKIFLGRWIQEREWTIAICSGVKRPGCKIREHSNHPYSFDVENFLKSCTII